MAKEDPLEHLQQSLVSSFTALAAETDSSAAEREGIAELVPKIDRRRLPKEVTKVRGELDHFALKTRFHDPLEHQKTTPASPEAAAVFNALERARFEAKGMQMYRGIAGNIDAMDQAIHAQMSAEAVTGASNDHHMPEAARLLLREKILGLAPPPAAEMMLAPWREKLSQALNTWKGQQDILASQEPFARWAEQFLHNLEMLAEPNQPDQPPPEDAPDNDAEEEAAEDPAEQEQEEGKSREETMLPLDTGAESEDGEEGEDTRTDDQDMSGEMLPADYEPFENIDDIDSGDYRVFSTQYDEVIEAEDLSTPSELADLRKELDTKASQAHSLISRLANRLQRRLLAQQKRFWQFDLEQGVLDPARLARVVIDPQQPLSFKQEKSDAFRDTVVSLLIDNSGSMRGRPISIAAISVDILARTLERCGVTTEISGFTTRAWRGGRMKDAWIAAGKPAQPGRLNELRHIIYKYADKPYRRIRNNLGLMLQEGLLKENIDGEALIWGYRRLLQRPEDRKIMIVISDGAPVDDATLASNPSHILEQHLRTVITQIEAQDRVQLLAIGIGHDVTRYYQRSVMIRNVDELGGVLLGQLEGLLIKD